MKQESLLADTQFLDQAKDYLKNGYAGIEKESFRLMGNIVSPRRHPSSLGSPLTNKFITTDFGESLLEFVTRPESNNKKLLSFLDHIHYFFYTKVDDEILWPFSFPPEVSAESEIKIAEYGDSNIAQLKNLYRKGLSARYGRLMQSISGIHFNYSLHPEILKLIELEYGKRKGLTKNDIYIGGVRNILRLNWLLVYLFGSSPFVTKNFSVDDKKEFYQSSGVFLSKNATSLRMSDFGYSVPAQHKFKLSFNTLAEYIDSVSKYIDLKNPEFDFNDMNSSHIDQISTSYLQTEDELYSAARPKSNFNKDQRTLLNLSNGGIDYIELRSVDINPFFRSGIDEKTIHFLEAFIIFCIFDNSPYMTTEEFSCCKRNDQLVSRYGRKKGIVLQRGNKEVSIKEWSLEIFLRMEPILDLLEFNENDRDLLERRFIDIDSLPSLMVEQMIHEQNNNFVDYSIEIAKQNKSSLIDEFKIDSNIIKLLEDEASRSIKETNAIESNQEISFTEYLSQYLRGINND